MNTNLLKSLGVVALIILVGLAVRDLFPKTITTPPRITTVYDTVKVIDTVWATKLKHDTIYKVNIVEKVIHTPPETLTVIPTLSGLNAILIGQHVGDSSLVKGFSIQPDDSAKHILMESWEYQYWTPGPLKSIVLNGHTPALDFYDPPSPKCGLKCKAEWAGGGAIAVTILKFIFGK